MKKNHQIVRQLRHPAEGFLSKCITHFGRGDSESQTGSTVSMWQKGMSGKVSPQANPEGQWQLLFGRWIVLLRPSGTGNEGYWASQKRGFVVQCCCASNLRWAKKIPGALSLEIPPIKLLSAPIKLGDGLRDVWDDNDKWASDHWNQ